MKVIYLVVLLAVGSYMFYEIYEQETAKSDLAECVRGYGADIKECLKQYTEE